MGYDVVVSYAREDREIAATLCNQLTAEGVEARIVPREKVMDERYISEVNGMIASSKTLVVVLSTYSNASGQVIRELELANKNQLEILPVRLDDVKPSGSLAYYLAGKNWFSMLRKEVEPWETAHKISLYLQTGEAEPEKGKKKGKWSLFKSKRK